MDFLLHIVTAILSAYLAFTGSLADKILDMLPTEGSEVTPAGERTPDGALVELGTKSNVSLPEILIKNAAYQKAALVESIDPIF